MSTFKKLLIKYYLYLRYIKTLHGYFKDTFLNIQFEKCL